MTTETTTAIKKLCSEAAMPADKVEQVIEAAGKFEDEQLQLLSAQALADAWKRDQS